MTCPLGKHVYATRKAAKEAAKADKGTKRAYRCVKCRLWHVGYPVTHAKGMR